jgi:hypothetical protein
MQIHRILHWLAAGCLLTASCGENAPPSSDEQTRALGGGGTDYTPPAPWLNVTFNPCTPSGPVPCYRSGNLDGQNGWTLPAGYDHVRVDDDSNCAHMIKFKDTTTTVEAELDVADQTSGPQTIEFDVKRDSAARADSIAKFAVLGAVGGLGIKSSSSPAAGCA